MSSSRSATNAPTLLYGRILVELNLLGPAFLAFVILCLAGCSSTSPPSSQQERESPGFLNKREFLLISVKDQRLYHVKDQTVVSSHSVSTGIRGVGETTNSEMTPRGRHFIAEKVGAGLPFGAVIEGGVPTGEIVEVNSGRLPPPVVTRLLRLGGLERRNENTFERYIYIHGSPYENQLGRPASGGCIRMRSNEIVALFDRVEVGIDVEIFEEEFYAALKQINYRDASVESHLALARKGDPPAVKRACLGHSAGVFGFPKDSQSAVRWCTRGYVLGDI
ncbi:MAG: L,D-transpeptidase family protein, partial [Burkholderiales bacterium]